MRVAIGSLMQESNTYAPRPTTLHDFESTYLRRGDELLTGFGAAKVEIPGFIDVLTNAGAEIVPLLAAHAGSGGPVARADFDLLLTEMIGRLSRALPVDGVLLALHGAMVLEDAPDAEAEIIARIRAALPPRIPIGVSLDLHGHVTPEMLQPGTFLIGYQDYPHTDMFETGQRTARLLLDAIAGRHRPVMALAKRPMLLSPVNARTTDGPVAALAAQARAMERSGAVLHASIFPVQPWLDVPRLGFAALVCAEHPAAAQHAADTIADSAWAARAGCDPDLTPLPDAIRIGLSSPGLTVVGDPGDAPTSGSAADNAGVLRALLAAGADRQHRLVYLTLCDPRAASRATAAGAGAELTLPLGHHQTPDGDPVTITAQVQTLSDGTFTMQDEGARGSVVAMGPTAVLAHGALRIAVRSLPCSEWDTGIFHSVGLDLRQAALVFVKSPSHFRVSYERYADRILVADTPGATCANMRRLVFHHVTRPLWPLDDIP